MINNKENWIWLSHITSENTPAYGGGSGFKIHKEKQTLNGDSCNTVSFEMSNHIGSHVDAPNHFIHSGKTVDDYYPEDWMFFKPLVIDIELSVDRLININKLEVSLPSEIVDADFVIVNTGIGKFRDTDEFWKNSPIFSPELCDYLISRFPSFKALGMDAISLSSMNDRVLGRVAHKEFLGKGIRIFEDLNLSEFSKSQSLRKVIALPFRFKNADGSPVTVIGLLD